MSLEGAEVGELCGLCRSSMNEGAIKCAHCGAERRIVVDLVADGNANRFIGVLLGLLALLFAFIGFVGVFSNVIRLGPGIFFILLAVVIMLRNRKHMKKQTRVLYSDPPKIWRG